MKVLESSRELGVKKTPLTVMAIGIGGSYLALSTGVFTLQETLLLIIAISTTVDASFDYFGQEVSE